VPSAVEIRELVVRYPTPTGDVMAVDGLNLAIPTGTVCTLLGPNGAGKTSTVETLEGYRKPTTGTVRVLGLDPINDAKALAPRIGVMLQRNGVYVTMNPREVMRLFASYYGNRALDADVMLETVGLGSVAATPWRRLSGGEQQRLSLGLALIGRPDVAFLDEPTASVDPTARILVRDIIGQLRTDGVTVVLTTHDLDEAQRLSDHVVIIDHGKVLAEGTPTQLMRGSGRGGVRFRTAGTFDTTSLGLALGGTVSGSASSPSSPSGSQSSPATGTSATGTSDGEYLVDMDPTPANIAALTNWLAQHDLAIEDLKAGTHSLEDVFFRLTATAQSARAEAESAAADGPGSSARQSRRNRGGRS
jgi:ABC-2 type transport system ATP-binding protein